MWHPKGVLMASLTEHTQAVNVLAMVRLVAQMRFFGFFGSEGDLSPSPLQHQAPDYSFFASASDDGCVKIWNWGCVPCCTL